MDGDPESRSGEAGTERGRRTRRSGIARGALWAVGGALGLAMLTLASTAVGMKLHSHESFARLHGRWYWVVSEGTGYTVKSKTEDRCGVPVYVGRELIEIEGFGLPAGVRRRVWTIDPNRDLRDAGYRAAVVERMRTQPDMAAWAGCLEAHGGSVTERYWLGTTMYGASVVVPGLGLVLFVRALGFRAWGAFKARRAQRRVLCTACGYSLKELDLEETAVCPECGTERISGAKPAPTRWLPSV